MGAEADLDEWLNADNDPYHPLHARVAEHLALIAFLLRVLPPKGESQWLARRFHAVESEDDSTLAAAFKALDTDESSISAMAIVVRTYQVEMLWRLVNAIHEGAEVVPFAGGEGYRISFESETGETVQLESLFELLVRYVKEE